MRQYVKALRLFTIFILTLHVSHAQINSLASLHQDMLSSIQQVIGDYPNQFKNITGELIMQNPQSADYRCTVKIDDAEESSITKYTSSGKEIYSWQALLLTTENFNEAKRKFRAVYAALNNHLINNSYLKGEYEAPAEEKKFTNILFSFTSGDEITRKLKLEVVMESEMMEWKVKILIYDREREDNEKGPRE